MPVISNCGTPTEKFSEFLDYLLNQLWKKGDHISKTGNFPNTIKKINTITENAIWVTTDVVGKLVKRA